MKRWPNIISVMSVIQGAEQTGAGIRRADGTVRYVPLRPLGFAGLGYRLRAAWLVWTGRADALVWPGQ